MTVKITEEAIKAAAKKFRKHTGGFGKDDDAIVVRAILKAALPFLTLPIAGEGKAELYTKLIAFLGKVQGVSMGVAMSGKDHPNPDGALMDLFNEAQELYLEHLDSPSSPGKDGGQEVEAGRAAEFLSRYEALISDSKYRTANTLLKDEGVSIIRSLATQPASTALVEAGKRWRVFEDVTHGWWGIEVDGDNDADPILYPIKINRESLDNIVEQFNAR